jgi:hypothetical protein
MLIENKQYLASPDEGPEGESSTKSWKVRELRTELNSPIEVMIFLPARFRPFNFSANPTRWSSREIAHGRQTD